MVRSRRRTPVVSVTTATSEKLDKRWVNRDHRSARHQAVLHVLVETYSELQSS